MRTLQPNSSASSLRPVDRKNRRCRNCRAGKSALFRSCRVRGMYRKFRLRKPAAARSVRFDAKTAYLAFRRKATRSANSCGVSCLSSPAGIMETRLGRISSISSRGTWIVSVALAINTSSSGGSL